MGSQRSLRLGEKFASNSKETWAKTEQHSSHLRNCGVFLRHHQLNQRKVLWIPLSRKERETLQADLRVRFSSKTLQSAKKRERKPTLGLIQRTHPLERSFSRLEMLEKNPTRYSGKRAMGSQRSLGRNVYKMTGDLNQKRAEFSSPSEFWCLPAPFSIEPTEREFVVDSGASMHLLSRKDMNAADTVRVYRNHTKVITANREVQTNEEDTVYVKDLDLFVTVQLLDRWLKNGIKKSNTER